MDVVRVRSILPEAADFPATWPVLRAAFGEIRPAAAMIEAGLADPRMKIVSSSRACARGTADRDRSGTVDGADLGTLLASWGDCPYE